MILITIPIWQDNAAQTDQLLEFIFAQNDRNPIAAHVLLVNAPGVDKEIVERIKISAELAFRGVHQLEIRKLADDRAPKWRNINNVFTQTAMHISKCFRFPFFWMEPDCVPVARGWFSRLVLDYGTQPQSYFGTRLKIETAGKPAVFIMARNGIYPSNAILDIPAAEAPFEIASAANIFPKFYASKLIQQTAINDEEDLAKLRPDAIIIHGDKQGVLRRQLEAGFSPEPRFDDQNCFNPPTKHIIPVAPVESPVYPEAIQVNKAPRRGRATKAEVEARLAKLTANETRTATNL